VTSTPTSPNPTWYDVLGVSRDASPAVIKAAWRNATDKFEPGSGSGQFRMFNEAADVLLDPERRAAYDASLDGDQARVRPAGPSVEEPAPPPPAPLVDEPTDDGPTAVQPGTHTYPKAERRRERAERRARKSATRSAADFEAASPLAGILAVVLALLTVLALVAAGFFAFQARNDAQTADARDKAPAAAENAAKAILSYDYRRLPTDRKRAEEFLTPKYKKDYEKTFKLLEKQKDGSPGAAIQTKTSVTASVVGSGVMDADPDTARVLVFVNQVSKRPGRDPQMFQNRVAMTMKQVEDRWLVDNLKSY
jgi:Mce-associated membrane protein